MAFGRAIITASSQGINIYLRGQLEHPDYGMDSNGKREIQEMLLVVDFC
jgi:hypothetical protein